VEKIGQTIVQLVLETSSSAKPNEPTVQRIRAKQFIDASYEGDLMAKAGVSYTVGREANAQYAEKDNGVQLRGGRHQFPDGVDPYRIPGKPESGLLWGISDSSLAEIGSGDKKVQAYNYRICLTDDPANQVAIARPNGYDSTRYELLLRQMALLPWASLSKGLIWSLMPNRKTDINNLGGFSTDHIGMNYGYAEGDYATRERYLRDLEDYTKGFLYFLGHDNRVSDVLRKEMLTWGLPKDEYTDNGHWSYQPYIREARRMTGAYVMTQANCEGVQVVPDGVGMAAYTMDSHFCQRIVIEKNGVKMVKNEGLVEVHGFPPYPISYRALTPKSTECQNLLVPVCLSASHIAYGSIRMEPVFMVLGQSVAVAASMAIDANVPVQRVDVTALQKKIRENPLLDGSTPDVVVDNDDATGVSRTGDWKPEQTGGYGPSFWFDDQQGAAPKTVRFTPTLSKAGRYVVYAYLPRRNDASTKTTFRLYDGRQAKTVAVKRDKIQVTGQTAGTWVNVGQLTLPAGKASYVEIASQGADGTVVADAIQWVAVP
jgi:hypothetical protein